VVGLVIVAQEMQQAMKGQNPQFLRVRVAFAAGLSARNSFCNSKIAQKSIRLRTRATVRGKGQHVGDPIDAAVAAVETPHLGIAHERDADAAAGRCRRGARQPRAETSR
jgi:hypothetical protein